LTGSQSTEDQWQIKRVRGGGLGGVKLIDRTQPDPVQILKILIGFCSLGFNLSEYNNYCLKTGAFNV